MDILIKTSDGSERQRWDGDSLDLGKVLIPGTKADYIYIDAGIPRPVDVGPDHFLTTATVIEPTLGPDQNRVPETVVVVGQTVTVNRPAVDMTVQEIADRDRNNDESALQSDVLKLAHINVELVTMLIANGTISGPDFSAKTERFYQDVKAIADRLNP